MPLAVFRSDLASGGKGLERDIIACLGIVADFDDPDAAKWPERLPIPPNYVLETSASRFQASYLFDKPERSTSSSQCLGVSRRTPAAIMVHQICRMSGGFRARLTGPMRRRCVRDARRSHSSCVWRKYGMAGKPRSSNGAMRCQKRRRKAAPQPH